MIEKLILSHLILNTDYGRKVIPFLNESYFHDKAEKTVFRLIKSYTDLYNNFPTREALFIDLSNTKNLSDDVYKTSENVIRSLDIDPDTQIEWLLQETEKFCQSKALYNSIMESIKIINDPDGKADIGQLPKLLKDALAVSFDSNIGHDFLENWEHRYEYYHKTEAKVPFDIEYLNKITAGGVSRKTLNILLGGVGVGKTLCMSHFAASHLASGHNVLYITLEMSEEKIAERIDANLLDVSIADLKLLPRDAYEKRMDRLHQKTKGKLIIKEYATATAGVHNFRHLLQEMRLKKNFVPDVIYVDYLNLCVSSRIKYTGNVNSYTYVKAIAEELRGLGVEYDVPIISATQLNREGFGASDIDMTHTSESFGLPATCDIMLAIRTSEQLEALGQYEFKQLKNRYNDPAYFRRFVVGVDKSKMRLYDVEETAQTLAPEISSEVSIQTFDSSKFEFLK